MVCEWVVVVAAASRRRGVAAAAAVGGWCFPTHSALALQVFGPHHLPQGFTVSLLWLIMLLNNVLDDASKPDSTFAIRPRQGKSLALLFTAIWSLSEPGSY